MTQRTIKINEQVSILIEQEDNIDIATAYSENALISKLIKAVDGIRSPMHKMVMCTRKRFIKYTKQQALKLIEQWRNENNRERVAQIMGMDITKAKKKMYYLQTRYGVK